MCTVVLTHVDEFTGFLRTAEGSLYYHFRRTYKGHHGTVGSFTRIHIQYFDTLTVQFGSGYFVDDLINNVLIASL